jgi:F0F1-type ATP synthase membrane subunit c/vacuolar-type H+-ATPase subunit K
MPAPAPSTLTRREQAVADFFRRPMVADGCMTIAAALLGAATRGVAQGYCHPPSDPPVGDGGNFCAKVSGGFSWIGYVAAAVALAAAIRVIARRTDYSRRLALLIVVVAAIGVTAWVYSLPDLAP